MSEHRRATVVNGTYMGIKKDLLFPIAPNTAIDIFSGKFSQKEIEAMIMIRNKIAKGRITEQTPESIRFGFVCWLIDHGKLKS